MQPIATDGVARLVCMSVCLSFCCLRSWACKKRLNRSWCRCWWLGWAQAPRNRRASEPRREGAIFEGLAGPLKSIVSLLQCMQQKIDNGVSATAAADYTGTDWPGIYELFPVKHYPCDAACRQNSLTTCFFNLADRRINKRTVIIQIEKQRRKHNLTSARQ